MRADSSLLAGLHCHVQVLTAEAKMYLTWFSVLFVTCDISQRGCTISVEMWKFCVSIHTKARVAFVCDNHTHPRYPMDLQPQSVLSRKNGKRAATQKLLAPYSRQYLQTEFHEKFAWMCPFLSLSGVIIFRVSSSHKHKMTQTKILLHKHKVYDCIQSCNSRRANTQLHS